MLIDVVNNIKIGCKLMSVIVKIPPHLVIIVCEIFFEDSHTYDYFENSCIKFKKYEKIKKK